MVTTQLCQQGVFVFPYLNDWLLKGCSDADVQVAVKNSTTLFSMLGLQLNTEKSFLLRVHKGHPECFNIQSIGDRFLMLKHLIMQIQVRPQVTAKLCLQLLGHMAACTFATLHTQIHLHCFQNWPSMVYTPNRCSLNKLLSIPHHVLVSLRRWRNPGKVCSGDPFTHPHHVTIVSNVSLLGWGVHFQERTVQGRQTTQESTFHINLLELRAVKYACQHFLLLINCPFIIITNKSSSTT